MLFNYKMTFMYDGTNYYGYQKQKTHISIQEQLETIISRLCNEKIDLIASGRTDRYVHAKGQVANFKTHSKLDLYHFKHTLNLTLDKDIYVKDVVLVDKNFHARYDVVTKQYRYLINIGEYDVFKANYYWYINKKLDIELMKEASKVLIGKKDFISFSSALRKDNTIREIYKIDINIENDILIIDFYGNGFLRYMVRKLVMILIDIGLNKKSIDDLKNILLLKNKSSYSRVAPAHGLYLMEVKYE